MVELSTFLEKTPPDKKLEPISNDDLLVVEVNVGVWIQKMANWTICFHAQFLCHRPLISHALWGVITAFKNYYYYLLFFILLDKNYPFPQIHF